MPTLSPNAARRLAQARALITQVLDGGAPARPTAPTSPPAVPFDGDPALLDCAGDGDDLGLARRRLAPFGAVEDVDESGELRLVVPSRAPAFGRTVARGLAS